MANAITRIGDQGVSVNPCTLHEEPTPFTTVFTSDGSAICDILGVPVCINGLTIGLASCGHHTICVGPSSGTSESGTSEGSIHLVGHVGKIVEGGSGTYVATTGSGITDSE
jgi:hypothetical protein